MRWLRRKPVEPEEGYVEVVITPDVQGYLEAVHRALQAASVERPVQPARDIHAPGVVMNYQLCGGPLDGKTMLVPADTWAFIVRQGLDYGEPLGAYERRATGRPDRRGDTVRCDWHPAVPS